MRAWNRWKLLLAYLRRRDAVDALPVENVNRHLSARRWLGSTRP
jgi:hypothetical protein